MIVTKPGQRVVFEKPVVARYPSTRLYAMDGVAGSTVLALIGVFLGTAGTLVGQYLATRVEVQRDRQQRRDAERAERKEAISGFLAAAQRVELVLDRRGLGLPAPEDPADERLHDLWLAKKAVELTCSHETAQAAHDYTKTLHAHMRNAISPGQGATKRECRHAFMEAARDALESGRPRIRR
ncbi:hypothetical protein [Streptomyces rapamycinicus]|uniref:Uncharacterized protein n=1 Tax=Streptomyces rapamycinicus TaxID=1226757 RepID=A0ABR6LY66_9ACTN|nr:hypothetical protein [Streptomyces rapamycinicus]MBB4779053.1 hypothetical protein [Streptomyces rapamycinicus]MBB4787245.1 hypothetical protein [Streptomyces rapamycinicus]